MRLQAWITNALDQLASDRASFVSAHLDELELEHRSWEDAARALSLGVAELPSEWRGRLSLALPLMESPSLMTAPPDDIRSEADSNEPPSLYLFSVDYFARHLTDGEEFHASIPMPINDPRMRAEFVSSRDAQSADRGWDYVNTLWIHFLRGGGA